jgi:hypothetical protein
MTTEITEVEDPLTLCNEVNGESTSFKDYTATSPPLGNDDGDDDNDDSHHNTIAFKESPLTDIAISPPPFEILHGTHDSDNKLAILSPKTNNSDDDSSELSDLGEADSEAETDKMDFLEENDHDNSQDNVSDLRTLSQLTELARLKEVDSDLDDDDDLHDIPSKLNQQHQDKYQDINPKLVSPVGNKRSRIYGDSLVGTKRQKIDTNEFENQQITNQEDSKISSDILDLEQEVTKDKIFDELKDSQKIIDNITANDDEQETEKVSQNMSDNNSEKQEIMDEIDEIGQDVQESDQEPDKTEITEAEVDAADDVSDEVIGESNDVISQVDIDSNLEDAVKEDNSLEIAEADTGAEEDNEAGDVKAEDIEAEDVEVEDIEAEDIEAEDIEAEDIEAEDIEAEDMEAEDVEDDVEDEDDEAGEEEDGSNDIPEGGDEEDDEEDGEDDEEEDVDLNEQRKLAIEELKLIEQSFAELRDKLYQDKLGLLEHELQLCLEGNHPELSKICLKVNQFYQDNLRLANANLSYKLKCIDIETIATRTSIHQNFMKNLMDTKRDLVTETTSRWYKINKERNQIDQLVTDYNFSAIPTIPNFTVAGPVDENINGNHESTLSKKAIKQNTIIELVQQRNRINQQLGILNGLIQFHGFPSAISTGLSDGPNIGEELLLRKATPEEINEDLVAMGIPI